MFEIVGDPGSFVTNARRIGRVHNLALDAVDELFDEAAENSGAYSCRAAVQSTTALPP